MKIIRTFSKMHSIAAAICVILMVGSCTKNYELINSNRNALTNIGSPELPFLFARAEQWGTNSGWSYQVAQNLFHDQYAQYFANSTTYFPSDRLVIRMDWINSLWSPLYTNVAPQLLTLFEKYEPNSAEYALAQIWWVISFQRVTDTWGPIPYFQVGADATGIPYDPQEQIYNDFFIKLDSAVNTLQGLTAETPYGSFDLIYAGNVNKWIKFANTLRLRLAIRISGVSPDKAKTEAEAAVASGVMTVSPDDDALIQKSNTNGDFNGLSVMDWNEFRMSSAMESVLKGYDDPRTPVYFNPAKNTGTYEGMRNGLEPGDMAAPLNQPDNNSRHGDRWNSGPSGTQIPSNVMASAEAYFLRAEGALLGWNMGGGTAKEYYEEGITNSLHQWGITNPGVITAYINSVATPVAPNDAENSPPLTDVPVLFGATAEIQKEQITLQKWLALYPDGNEAWADLRRSNALQLYPVVKSDNPELPNPAAEHIRRINFITDEKQTNGAEVDKAINLLGSGGDLITTPLWWDKH